jgi:hypothetical protein
MCAASSSAGEGEGLSCVLHQAQQVRRRVGVCAASSSAGEGEGDVCVLHQAQQVRGRDGHVGCVKLSR